MPSEGKVQHLHCLDHRCVCPRSQWGILASISSGIGSAICQTQGTTLAEMSILKRQHQWTSAKIEKISPQKSFLAYGFKMLAMLSKSRSVIAIGFSHVLVAKA